MILKSGATPAGEPGRIENTQTRGADEQSHINPNTSVSQNSHQDRLNLALQYAGRGFPVFWIPPEVKAPATSWNKVATTDPEAIKRMAAEHFNCNWGIATGCEVGDYKVLVIDVDTKDGDGLAEWEALVKKRGDFPESFTVETPSNGHHIFLWVPKNREAHTTAKKLSPNIDTRGKGALVVMEGSQTKAEADPSGRTVSGVYVALNAGKPIAVAPDWLLDLLDHVKNPSPSNQQGDQRGGYQDYPPKSHSEQVEEARQALEYLNPDMPHDDWVRVIPALHCLGSDGYQLAYHWSAQSSQFKPAEFETKWRSFSVNRTIKLPTLFWMARQAGWTGNKQKHHTNSRSQPQAPGSNSGQQQGKKTFEPVPLPPELAPVPPFDYEMLPPVFAAFVKDLAERMSAAPDFIALTMLACAGAVIGRKLGIRPQANTDWTEPVNLWVMVIGRAGVMKSPGMQGAMTFLERLAAAATRIYEEEYEAYKKADAFAQLEAEAAKKRVKDALKAGQGGVSPDDLVVDEPEKPIHRRYITNDATEAALLAVLQDNPNGILLFRDELVGLLRSLEKDSNAGFRELLLQTWNGNGSYVTDRIERGFHLLVKGLMLSLIGGTQPGKIAKFIKQAVGGGAGDDGLMQRFLLVWPDMSPYEEKDVPPDREKMAAVHRVFRDLDELTPETAGAEQDYDMEGEPDGLPYVRFTPDALPLFQSWRNTLEIRLRDGSLHPAMESHLSKFRKVVPALATISHFADGGRGSVGKVPLLRALALSEYLEAHANRTYGSVSMPKVSAARQILNKIKENKLPNPFRARDVTQPGWAGLNRETVPDALQLLVEHCWIAAEEPDNPKGGRPTVNYYVNPQAEGKF